jgi:hypothetical protein
MQIDFMTAPVKLFRGSAVIFRIFRKFFSNTGGKKMLTKKTSSCSLIGNRPDHISSFIIHLITDVWLIEPFLITSKKVTTADDQKDYTRKQSC